MPPTALTTRPVTSAGPPSSREPDGADKLGTATLLGGLTNSVDEIVLRGDHDLL